MNDLVLFIHILLLFLRIIGLIISIHFYNRTKNNFFIVFSLGWFIWILGMIFPFFYVYNNNLLLIMKIINIDFGDFVYA